MRLSSEELGNCLQTPTLIGCMFLTILRKILYFLAPPAAISGAFDYDTVFNTLSNLRVFQPANPSLTTHRTPDHSPGAWHHTFRYRASLFARQLVLS